MTFILDHFTGMGWLHRRKPLQRNGIPHLQKKDYGRKEHPTKPERDHSYL